MFIGRPVLYANASEGQRGVEKLFDMLKDEIELGMKLLGCTSIEDLRENGRKYLVKSTIPIANL